MKRLEWSIAWRYLRSRRGSRLLSLISLIAIGGVIVGVSALIVIIGVMNGLQTDLREKILIGSPDIRVLNFSADMKMPEWRSVIGRIREQPGVVGAAPFVITQAGITRGNDYGEGIFVVGIEPLGTGDEVTAIRRHAKNGDFSFRTRDGQRRGVVVGARLAQRLGLMLGVDSVTVIPIGGAKFNASIGAIIPRFERLEVTGIFETGMFEYDDRYVFTSIETGQDLAGYDDGAVTGIEVKTESRWEASATATRLVDSLGIGYRAEDWQTQNSSLFQALKLEKLAMSFILLLIVIVAAFNIVSTLTMVVTDKTREIGIMRAMGLPAASIRRIFFFQGVVIGVVGTGVGLILGLGAAVALDRYHLISLDPSIYFIDHLPVETQPVDVVFIVLASLAIASIATIYPAVQASRLYPVEAIRHE
jgi:lipoprotein-releasing system permease protein